MYSQKIINRFRNPKFAGRIKNPDGVGEEGSMKCGDVMKIYLKVKNDKINDIKFETYGCLPPDEKIVLPNEWKAISKLSKSEIVLNENGKKTSIKKVYKRKYNGELIRFVPFVSPYNAFSVTPEHPILCIRREYLKKTRRTNSKNSWLRVDHSEIISTKPDYFEAYKLKVGDYLVFSYNKEIKDSKIYSKSLLRLIGYYLSEGNISAKQSAVAFSFNKKEKEYIREVKDLIKKIVGKEAKSRIRDNVSEVYVNSREFVRKILKEAGKLAAKKELSDSIMVLPPAKQLEIIKTYFNGDGNKTTRRKGEPPTYRLATSSEKLAIQFQEILARNNIFASIRKQKQTESIINGRKINGLEYIFIVSYKKERDHKFVHLAGGYFLIPIKKIEVEKFKGSVYNLEVSSKQHSYLVKGFVVHNCVAAIASSDAMCELAKGKTINEVKKIKYDDIIKKMGGDVPAIKIHCSVLGTMALKNALDDYNKKSMKN